MMMRYLLAAGAAGIVIGLLGYSFLAATAGSSAPLVANTPAARLNTIPQQASTPICTGEQPTFELQLTPTRSISTPSGEQLEAALALENHLQTGARVIYSVEVFDDRENVVAPATVVPARRLAGLSTLQDGTLRTPTGLSDGFYELRVQAAVQADDGGKTGAIARLYVQVQRGAIIPLSFEDWAAMSRAEEGV